MSRIRTVFLCLCCASLQAALAQTAGQQQRLAEGSNLRAAGRYAEAEAIFQDMLRDSKRDFAAAVLVELAATEQDLGDFGEAERLLTRSLEIHPNPAAEGHLGSLYLEENRAREAQRLFQHALETQQKVTPPDSAAIAIDLAGLAVAYRNLGKLSRAEGLLRQSLTLFEESFGPDHPMVTTALTQLGVVLGRERKYLEALEVTERAWRILGQDPRVAEPDKINTLSTLGMLYSCTGHASEAEIYSRQAVAKAEAVYGPDHYRTGCHLANYAAILKRIGRKQEAKAAEQRSKAILSRNAQAGAMPTVHVNALR